jgi:hypothetical protein
MDTGRTLKESILPTSPYMNGSGLERLLLDYIIYYCLMVLKHSYLYLKKMMFHYLLEYQEKKRLQKKLKKQVKRLYYYQFILMLQEVMENGRLQQDGLAGLHKMLVRGQRN